MTDNYYNAPGQMIQGGAQGQPVNAVTGWNTPGSNQVILPTQINVSSVLAQEFEVPLPANRVDYIDVIIKGSIANVSWAGAAGPAYYVMDMISRLRLTDNMKNTPIDVNGVQLRALLAYAQPIDAPSCAVDALLSASNGAATTGLINVIAAFRIYGPFQLSYMSRPVLKLQFTPSTIGATSASFKCNVAVMMSDLQVGDDAKGYYYTVETRNYDAHNIFAMGSSMVQDIMIMTGKATLADTLSSLSRVATENVASNQKVLWEDAMIFAHLGYNQVFATPPTPLVGLSANTLLTTGTSYTGLGVLIPHVDIEHNMYRQLIVDRATGGSGSTTVMFRNQVLG